MKPFHLLIATPDGLCYDGEAESLLVRTDDGDVEILAGHTDLLASVGIGRARIRINGNDRYASAAGGFLTVARGEVKLVAITFEFSHFLSPQSSYTSAHHLFNRYREYFLGEKL